MKYSKLITNKSDGTVIVLLDPDRRKKLYYDFISVTSGKLSFKVKVKGAERLNLLFYIFSSSIYFQLLEFLRMPFFFAKQTSICPKA